jgi:hypothetical protein
MRRNVVIGLIALLILAGIVYLYRKNRQESLLPPTPEPTFEETFEDKFNIQVPEDVDKAELKDVSGGDGRGLATRKYDSGRFTHAVLADLPAPASGYFYEGWLVRGKEGDENFAYISTGRLSLAKGGYMLEFSSSTDYSEYSLVVVTLEAIDDKKPEKHILEGGF